MATTFTYDQFEKAARDAGLFDSFSAADLNLARVNPDAGMSILGYKKDFVNATTAEARALANQGAESVRSSHGNYTSGNDGSNFYLNQLSPSSFTNPEAPTYTNNYSDQITAKLDKITNRDAFSYDPSTDPLYAQYKQAYTREGQRATADALGSAAAATGGIPSSYAATAAAQAGNYYAAQMADKIPELHDLAYDKYLNEYQLDVNDLSLLQGQEQSDYNKYLNNLSQYNTDRTFNYSVLLDEINSQTAERDEELNKALIAAQYANDWSHLGDLLGADTSGNSTNWERALQLWELANNQAVLGANYGDWRALEALGITPSAENLYHFNNALKGIYTGNYRTGASSGGASSRGSSSGGGSSGGSSGSVGAASPSANNTAGGNTLAGYLVNAVKGMYPNGVRNAKEWQSLVNVYGIDALTGAGIYYTGS